MFDYRLDIPAPGDTTISIGKQKKPVFVDTGMLAADSSLTWNLEASWRKGPFWLSGYFPGAERMVRRRRITTHWE